MAGKRKRPVITENFVRNLDAIEEFLKPEGSKAFQRLLDRLFQQTIPTLSRFPEAGRSFLGHPIRSLEAARLQKRLKRLMGAEDVLREFIVGDYLVLYLIRKRHIFFLSIKHHRQLSYDLSRFWGGSIRSH